MGTENGGSRIDPLGEVAGETFGVRHFIEVRKVRE
jgi:hypothetical protein